MRPPPEATLVLHSFHGAAHGCLATCFSWGVTLQEMVQAWEKQCARPSVQLAVRLCSILPREDHLDRCNISQQPTLTHPRRFGPWAVRAVRAPAAQLVLKWVPNIARAGRSPDGPQPGDPSMPPDQTRTDFRRSHCAFSSLASLQSESSPIVQWLLLSTRPLHSPPDPRECSVTARPSLLKHELQQGFVGKLWRGQGRRPTMTRTWKWPWRRSSLFPNSTSL